MNDKALVSPAPKRGNSTPVSPKYIWHFVLSRHEIVLSILLLIAGALLGLGTDTFLTWTNLSNFLRAFSWLAIVAFGESMVIIIGGIDLSVGSVMALAGLISALSMRAKIPMPVAIAAGLLTGGLAGWSNGTLVGRLKLPPFMVTLATMSIARGIIFGLTGGWPVRSLSPAFRRLGQSNLQLGPFSLPFPVLFMLGLAVLVTLLMEKTVLGKYIYTVGNSERALLISGVNVARVKVLVYTFCGVLTAIGGVLMTARLGVAAPTAATGYELDIIAAAVIGGSSMFGGEGSTLGVLLGATVMQLLRSGLVLLGFPAHWQKTAIGTMILAFILLDHWRRENMG